MAVRRRRTGRARGGRPPKPPEEVRHNRIAISLTDAELAEVQRRAEREGRPLSGVLHEIVRRSLRRGSR